MLSMCLAKSKPTTLILRNLQLKSMFSCFHRLLLALSNSSLTTYNVSCFSKLRAWLNARLLTQHNIETVLLRALERNGLYELIQQDTSLGSAIIILEYDCPRVRARPHASNVAANGKVYNAIDTPPLAAAPVNIEPATTKPASALHFAELGPALR